MNWEMTAAIAQVAAAVGLIPSLIYLAAQIREQNKERRRAAVNVLIGQWSALLKSMIDSSEFADIYLRGLQHFDDLAPAKKIRFGAFLVTSFKTFEGMYHYKLDGTLDGSLWKVIERTMADLVSSPGTQEWWQIRRSWHTQDFADVSIELYPRNTNRTHLSVSCQISRRNNPDELVTENSAATSKCCRPHPRRALGNALRRLRRHAIAC